MPLNCFILFSARRLKYNHLPPTKINITSATHSHTHHTHSGVVDSLSVFVSISFFHSDQSLFFPNIIVSITQEIHAIVCICVLDFVRYIYGELIEWHGIGSKFIFIFIIHSKYREIYTKYMVVYQYIILCERIAKVFSIFSLV